MTSACPLLQRRDLSSGSDLSFEKVLSRDKQQCGMRLVCELEARNAAGENVGEYGQLIIDGLFRSVQRSIGHTGVIDGFFSTEVVDKLFRSTVVQKKRSIFNTDYRGQFICDRFLGSVQTQR